MKKVLVITYYFPPSGGAGVQRWLKMMKFLPEYGVEPIVLTVDEKYASYPQVDLSLLNDVPANLTVYRTKSKEILSVYKKVSPNNEVPYGGFANEPRPNLFQKVARFIRGNFFLPDPRRGWNRYAYKKACQIIEEENISTVITTSPPHSTQLIGLKLKKKYPSIKWFADLRDPWTDIYYNKDLYQTSWAKNKNLRYERSVLANTNHIITVSEDCARLFSNKVVATLPITVLPNGYDPDDFANPTPVSNHGKKVLSYVGVFSPQYPMDVLVEGLKQIADAWSDKLLLRFVGVVCNEAKQLLATLPYTIEYVDYVPHAKAIDYMCAADVLLLCIPDIPNNQGILTGKLFEYLAAQKSILLLGPKDGDAAAIIEKCQAGSCCAYNSQQVASCLNGILQTDTTISSTNYQQYSRRYAAQRLAQMIHAV